VRTQRHRPTNISTATRLWLIRSRRPPDPGHRTVGVDKNAVCVHIHTAMAKELDLTTMENCVCFNLRWVSRAITQFFVSELNHHGLLPTQTPILAALAARPKATMAELSDWLGMDRTTLVRNLRPLERDGLVKATGKGRGNKVALAITPRGKSGLAKFIPEWRQAQRKVVKTLGEERWGAILADLEKAALSLSK
jgi:DNA-binding MarR family transcriptional regulator